MCTHVTYSTNKIARKFTGAVVEALVRPGYLAQLYESQLKQRRVCDKGWPKIVMNGVDEQELLTVVPQVLKRLCKIVARGFYESEHAAIITLLTNSKYPCLQEDDLSRMLGFDKKQLRQSLVRLKNEKLIKQRIHKEKNSETGTTLSFNYYFINYKVFVNVVKYKLDHVRKKIESEEKQAKNRPSFVCTQCEKKYSDLEVDRLLDFETGHLKCTICEGLVEEDSAEIKQSNTSRTSLARFNEQMEPIFKLLRECEEMNLSPAILEPEPQRAQLESAASGSRPSGPRGNKPAWANDAGGSDVSGPGIKVDIMGGEEDEVATANKPRPKEAPIWMRQSTVVAAPGIQTDALHSTQVPQQGEATHSKTGTAGKDDEILAELLVHESVNKKPRLDINEALGEGAGNDDSDSGSDESDFETPTPGPAAKASDVTESMDGHTESEQEDDEAHEIKIKVGDKMVAINDVTDKMLRQMTTEEHDAYTKALQHVYSQFY